MASLGTLLANWFGGPRPSRTTVRGGRTGGQPHGITGGTINVTPNMLSDTTAYLQQITGTSGQLNVNTPASSSISIAAANKMRTELLSDVGSTIRTIQDGLDNTDAKFYKMVYELNLWSDKPFGCTLFVVFIENGDGITSTDYNGYDLGSTINTATGASNKVINYGPYALSQMRMDNGVARYLAKIQVDITQIADAYARYYSKKELAEESSAELKVGITVNGQASQTVNYAMASSWLYGVNPRKQVIAF